MGYHQLSPESDMLADQGLLSSHPLIVPNNLHPLPPSVVLPYLAGHPLGVCVCMCVYLILVEAGYDSVLQAKNTMWSLSNSESHSLHLSCFRLCV